jgi:hypothetical protein
MVIRLDIETWVIGKGGIKNKEWEMEWVGKSGVMGAAEFCDACACLGIFLLL